MERAAEMILAALREGHVVLAGRLEQRIAGYLPP